MPLLLDWWMVGVDLESVHCDGWIDSCHVLVGPGETNVVLHQEFDECEPELGAESCPDLDFVVWIVRMDADVVEFIDARSVRLRRCIRSRL